MTIPRHLLAGHVEKISGKVLEDYPEIVKSMIRGKSGVYAMYRKDRL